MDDRLCWDATHGRLWQRFSAKNDPFNPLVTSDPKARNQIDHIE